MQNESVVHVIDDDQAVRESIAFLLEAAGLEVRIYESAPAFLAASDRPTGCIITDVRMPDMTGIELARRLRDSGSHEPVIIITGHADVPLAIEAMHAGVSDFLEKPFDDELLLASIKRVLELPPETRLFMCQAPRHRSAHRQLIGAGARRSQGAGGRSRQQGHRL